MTRKSISRLLSAILQSAQLGLFRLYGNVHMLVPALPVAIISNVSACVCGRAGRGAHTAEISAVTDQLLTGIRALATQVFDGFGQLVLCLVVIGPSATLQTASTRAAARDAAQSGSLPLGLR